MIAAGWLHDGCRIAAGWLQESPLVCLSTLQLDLQFFLDSHLKTIQY